MREFDRFVEVIRQTVAPVAHLTDAEIMAEFDPPMARLLVSLRGNLRDFDATAGGPVADDEDRALGEQVRRDAEERAFAATKRKHGGDA
jgi:hypothetical protein